MVRHSSATLVVALVLLGCYARTLVEAQKDPQAPPWMPEPPPQNPPPPKVSSWSPQPPPQNPPPPKVSSWSPQPPPQNPPPPKVSSWSPQPAPQPPKVPYRPPQPPPQNPPKQPTDVQVPQQPNVQDPQRPDPPPAPAQTCDVAIGKRVPCGLPDITASACNAISCCFDNNGCYYGKAVTVQCTKCAYFIVVVARDATLPNIDLGSIQLQGSGAGCTHVASNSAFAIYHFPLTSCDSVVKEEKGVIIYENRITSSYDFGVGDYGTITRDSSYELLFQCRYIGTSVETVVVQVQPADNPPIPIAAFGPIQVELRLANGKCVSKGCDEVDAAYTSYYVDSDYPVTKVLRELVFIEVRLLDKTDPNLVLTLGRCWTTTTPNPHSLPQWDILVDGCPYQNDRYLSSLVPVDASSGLDFPSHYRRIMFQMFTFVEPNDHTPLKDQVYIHCSTAVCVPGPGQSCQVNCPGRNKRGASLSTVKNDQAKIVATIGPVEMYQVEQ